MKVSIVIPSYTRHDKLRECLASIVKYTDMGQTEIVVVANGASEECRQVCADYPVTLLWFNEPLGYSKACNHGIRATESEFVILLNDDCELLPQPRNEWLDVLVKPFLQDGAVGVTGPQKIYDENSGQDFLIFFCVMVRRQCFNEVGLLDESFGIGFGEDTSFCIEARRKGWKTLQVPDDNVVNTLADIDPNTTTLETWKHDKMWSGNFRLFHDAESTLGRLENTDELLRHNRAILRERYGNDVDVSRAMVTDGWIAHDELLWLARQAKACGENATIIQIGAWHGKSSRAISDNMCAGSKLIDVDSFNGSSGEPDQHATAKEREGDHCFQWYWDNQYEQILRGEVIPMRMLSHNAAHSLAHRGIKANMIFIDGDHSAEGIQRDVEAWLPLLREGGLLCGHDYYRENEGPWWVHVRQYVEEKFPNVEKSATSIWHVRPHVEAVEPERGHVYDCFLFHNELDVLEIRLATLYDVVDRFVLVEATTTHSGQPKPLYFEENVERFRPYLDKISHVIVDLPTVDGTIYDQAWARERFQRDACMKALEDCQSNDVIIIGDADEIASPDAVRNYKLSDGLVRLKQRMFYYYLNCENKEGWDWQKIAPYSMVKERTPCGVRYPPAGEVPLIEGGGWHFSFLGDAAHVAQKIRDYSHQEYNTPEILADVEAAVAEGRDVFGRGLKYEFVSIDEAYPLYVYTHTRELLENGLIKPLRLSRSDSGSVVGAPDLSSRHWSVTASVSTKDRYQTTLPLALAAIFNQSCLPDKFILYDDSDERIPAEQLCQRQPFEGLFKLASDKGIKWEIQSTPRQGQVANHQHCLNTADTMFIWRVDDDEVPEPDCLKTLLNTIRDYERGGSMGKIGAVGGLVHHPGAVSELPQGVDGSLNDIAAGLSLQWFNWNGGVRETQHLYSTFLYQVDAARKAGGYPLGLSKVGHREESIFTHSLHRAGYKVLTTPWTKTYHLRDPDGGIRSNPDPAQWEHDEHEWQRLLKTWNVVTPETKLIVADFGLGDHLILRGVWSDLARKFPERKWTLALCYPEVFKDVADVTIISIADAKLLVGAKYDDYSLYRWMWDRNWSGSIVDAMKEFYSR